MASPETQVLWNKEKNKAVSRREVHWKVVQSKQAQLQKLDGELKEVDAQLVEERMAFAECEVPDRFTTFSNDHQYRSLEERVDRFSNM
eukprot:1279521-Pleurochrysis_carterae.AAC.1